MQKNSDWKKKVNDLFQTAQDEVRKTTIIGKKMLSASKTNSCLHDSLERLGSLAVKDIRSGKLKWDNPQLEELLTVIEQCEKDLEAIEKEVKSVKNVKFSAGPQDVGEEETQEEKEPKEKSEEKPKE